MTSGTIPTIRHADLASEKPDSNDTSSSEPSAPRNSHSQHDHNDSTQELPPGLKATMQGRDSNIEDIGTEGREIGVSRYSMKWLLEALPRRGDQKTEVVLPPQTSSIGSNRHHKPTYSPRYLDHRWENTKLDTGYVFSTPLPIRTVAKDHGLTFEEYVAATPRTTFIGSYRDLQSEYQKRDGHESLQADDSTSCCASDADSISQTTNGSASGSSSKGSMISDAILSGDSTKESLLSSKRGSRTGESEDEPPRKKPNREQDNIASNIPSPQSRPEQMPCPLFESEGCQGTDPAVSSLLRSLMSRHRVIICDKCCTRLPISDEEKPLTVKQKHTSEGCEPRCIGASCSDNLNGNVPHHRRTERCPSWQSLSNKDRWLFIWSLTNPGLDPPIPRFVTRPLGNMHDLQSRPRKIRVGGKVGGSEDFRQAIAAQEACNQLLKHELSTSNDRNTQLQRQFDKKIGNLKNIIETLLEHLSTNNISIPRSLRKRLHIECPTVMPDAAATDPTTQALPASIPLENGSNSVGAERQFTQFASSQGSIAAISISTPELLTDSNFTVMPTQRIGGIGNSDYYTQKSDINTDETVYSETLYDSTWEPTHLGFMSNEQDNGAGALNSFDSTFRQ